MSIPPADDAVVLFDMDGVLLHGDTMGTLLRQGFARRPWRFLPAALLVGLWHLLPPGNPGRSRIDRALVRVGLRGFDDRQFESLARHTATALAASEARNGELVGEVARLRDRGVRVIVVTASERRLAQGYLDAVGLAGVELLASELVFAPHTTAVFRVHNVGPDKVSCVERAGVDLSECLLYTDSASDLPLIERVGACVLVSPSKATMRIVRRAALSIPITVI
ncbi:MAG TPA: HAD family hydrolase [Microlunatus sp.]|nr:HAD family hydrolase [Microlunatus sp.]